MQKHRSGLKPIGYGMHSKVKNKRNILKFIKELTAMPENEQIPLTTLPGQETRLNRDMLTDAREGDILLQNATSH